MNRTFIDQDYDDDDNAFGGARQWFDLDKAQSWTGATRWDGANNADTNVGANMGQNLLRTAGGRWVLQTWSNWMGADTAHRWVTDEQAHEWLLVNEHEDAAASQFGPAPDERGPGRPEIGGRVSVRLGELLPALDAYAAERGVNRAEAVRLLIEQSLTPAV